MWVVSRGVFELCTNHAARCWTGARHIYIYIYLYHIIHIALSLSSLCVVHAHVTYVWMTQLMRCMRRWLWLYVSMCMYIQGGFKCEPGFSFPHPYPTTKVRTLRDIKAWRSHIGERIGDGYKRTHGWIDVKLDLCTCVFMNEWLQMTY